MRHARKPNPLSPAQQHSDPFRVLDHRLFTFMSELQKTIDELSPWFHNLHLPDGTQNCA
jgi:hypothetical protein